LDSVVTNKKQPTPNLSRIVGVTVNPGPFAIGRVRIAPVKSETKEWPPKPEIELRGGALKLYNSQAPEAMLSGPADTGKTYATLYKVDRFLREHPGAQATIARKVRATMDGSVLRTYKRLIEGRTDVHVYGGEKPEWYDYANGSRLWVAATPVSKPS
jgi:hypothetical protein